jgi:subtilisin-like proprotein convertase family protein
VTIADNGTVSIPLEIQDDVLLSDVNVLVHIRHTSVSDLELRLRSPAGTEVALLNRPACTDNNMFITFDDDSTFDPQNHCAGTTPWYSGLAAPVEALAAFNGESSVGTWQLIVSDRAARHMGEVRDWQLITSSPSVCSTCKIAVLKHNTTDGNVQVVVKDAVSGALQAGLDFGDALTPIAVAALPDLNGNGAPELAVLGHQAHNGKVQVFIKDARTGDLLSTQDFNSSYLPVGLTILPDLDGNGVPELAVLGQHLEDGKMRVLIKDALTGAASPTLSFGSGLTPVGLTTVEWPTPAP